jgi:hypothetical protein
MDLTSRYLGLVVVPGEYITRIEVEEFASKCNRLINFGRSVITLETFVLNWVSLKQHQAVPSF